MIVSIFIFIISLLYNHSYVIIQPHHSERIIMRTIHIEQFTYPKLVKEISHYQHHDGFVRDIVDIFLDNNGNIILEVMEDEYAPFDNTDALLSTKEILNVFDAHQGFLRDESLVFAFSQTGNNVTMLYPVIGFERIDPPKDSQGLSFGITTIVIGGRK